MLRNLKVIYGRQQDIGSLLPVQRRLAALSQDDPNELRDLGLLYAQTNRLGEAIDPLQAYLDAAPLADDVHGDSRPGRSHSPSDRPVELKIRSVIAIEFSIGFAKSPARRLKNRVSARPILCDTARRGTRVRRRR